MKKYLLYNPPRRAEQVFLKEDILWNAKIRGWKRRHELGIQYTVYTNDFNFLSTIQ